MAEAAFHWNLFICLVDRKKLLLVEALHNEVSSANEPTCPESSSL